MRASFLKALLQAGSDERVHLVTSRRQAGALGRFAERYSERWLDGGDDPPALIGFASGLALEGERVVFVAASADDAAHDTARVHAAALARRGKGTRFFGWRWETMQSSLPDDALGAPSAKWAYRVDGVGEAAGDQRAARWGRVLCASLIGRFSRDA